MTHGNMIAAVVVATLVVVAFAGASPALADCVSGAMSKTTFSVLDSRTVMLTGGYGPDIVIKTHSYISRLANVTVLKDSFCSHESSVLYVDEQEEDAAEVTVVR